jgi:HK97 family phage prohead protease
MSTITRPVAGELEQRAAPAPEIDGRRLRGIVPYGVESRDLGGFREILERGCLNGAQLDDLVARVDHDGIPLGRYPGTLELEDRDDGLHWAVRLPKSRADVREAVERGDLRAGSWRMVVDRDRWVGDVRHVEKIAELRDVSVVVNPAYPSAATEYRSQEENMTATATEELEVRTAPVTESATTPAEEPEPDPSPPAARGTLRVEDRDGPTPVRGLADEFRSRGFPGETATVDFDRVFPTEQRAVSWTGSIDNLNPVRRQGAGLAFDQRYAWPAFVRIGVDAATTAVQVMRQSQRTLAAPANVIRPLAATTPKPETSSVLEVVTVPLKQVASVQSGIPNVYLQQPLFNTVIEADLRLAVSEAIDKLVLDAIAASPAGPGAGSLIVAVRGAITVLQAIGYSPDTLILRPEDSEALDVLTTGAADEDYVFSPGQPAPGIWGLSRRVSKSAASPIVVDTTAFGRLYSTAISLARFEEHDGSTNTSLVRLEGQAAFGVERPDAAVRLTAAAAAPEESGTAPRARSNAPHLNRAC